MILLRRNRPLPVLGAVTGESSGDGGGVSSHCCRQRNSRYPAIVAGFSQEESPVWNTGWMKAGDAGAETATKIAVRTDQMSCLERPDVKFDLTFARRAGAMFVELGETVVASSGTD